MARTRGRRYWIPLIIVAIVVTAVIAPGLMLAAGILLILLVICAFIPKARELPRRALRLDPTRRVNTGVRLACCGLVGVFLVALGRSASRFSEEQEQIAGQLASQRAEQVRLTNDANAKVRSLFEEADAALQAGNIELAIQRLDSAAKIPQATELSDVNDLRGRIDSATNPEGVRGIMVGLSDDEFEQLRRSNETPTPLRFGYAVLEARAAEIANEVFSEVAKKREEQRQKRLADERKRREQERSIAEANRAEERTKLIEKHFSAWDGSHRGLTKLIKAGMNDPNSYEHVETSYVDKGDYLIVKTTFRGKNAFGGVVTNWVQAKVDLDGNVLEIIGRGP